MDAIVIGSGPNGLTAAATLARRGWKVLVLEAQGRPGGACYSVEGTLPGYVHDVGAAFFPFADDSPAFRDLDLTGAGLRWVNAPRESCHPAPDGSCVTISRDPEQSAISFGEDGPAWRRLALWRRAMGERLTAALLGPLPGFGAALRLGPYHLAWLMREGLGTTAGFALRHFRTEAARRVVPALGLHVDLGPDDLAGAGLGLVLALLASGPGFRISVGGARSITHALIRRLEEAGGAVRLNTRVERILVRGGRAVAVRTQGGDEIPAGRAVLADVGPPALVHRLLEDCPAAAALRRRMRRFRYGWGTFKMDWALSGPVPWTAPEARESAVIHAGDGLADLRAFTRQVRAGHLPDNPYLVIGQQSLADPSRAPGQRPDALGLFPCPLRGRRRMGDPSRGVRGSNRTAAGGFGARLSQPDPGAGDLRAGRPPDDGREPGGRRPRRRQRPPRPAAVSAARLPLFRLPAAGAWPLSGVGVGAPWGRGPRSLRVQCGPGRSEE